MNRAERRRLGVGKETVWKREVSPKERGIGDGWFGQLSQAWSNGKYAVMAGEVSTKNRIIKHVCIRNAAGTDIPWREKQRIKNELFGSEVTAIEFFPKESELVDEANMYHLWLLPMGYNLPFGLTK